MNIVHLCSVYKPSNGIFFVLKNLVPVQRRLGNDVSLYNILRNGFENEDIKYCGYSELKKIIKIRKPDLVIFHGPFNKEIIWLSYLLRMKGIPYMIELHGALSKQNMKTSPIKKKIYNFFFLNNIIKKAEGIIYLNKRELANSTVGCLNHNNVIIPNGCDIPSNITHYHNDKLELLFLGRLDREHKGLDVMIPAVKRAYDNGVSLHLSIFGRGYKDELEWLNKEMEGYQGVIDFYGEVFGEDKEKAFLGADVILLTSRYEGFPMTILEALSYGVPCIVTPDTNVSDIIADNNCGLVADFSVESVFEKIEEMSKLSRPELETLRENCRKTAENYSWEKIGVNSIGIYKEILE